MQFCMWSSCIRAPHRTQLELRCLSVGEIGPRPHRTERRLSAPSGGIIRDPRTSSQRSSCRCAGPAGAPSRRPVPASRVSCVAQVSMAGPWRVHTRPPLLRSMQALVRWLHCAPCLLHRPGGVLLRQNPTASEISDARFRAIYSGMRKLPPVKSKFSLFVAG